MKSTFLLGSLLSCVNAGQPLELSLSRVKGIHPRASETVREIQRRRTYTNKIDNMFYYYQIDVGIGTPSQLLEVLLDTGSSDLWVMDSSNPYCQEEGFDCAGSTFYSSASSSFVNVSTPFAIQYGDYTEANGTLATDVLTLGEARLQNATFALATSANSTACVFGVGFDQNEAGAYLWSNRSVTYPTYPNVPDLLQSEGLISTKAYSLYLNGRNSSSGNILWGGVDHAKYEGELSLVPMYNWYWQYLANPNQLRINLNTVSFNGCTLVETNIAVLLDSGTSYANLPQEIIDSLATVMDYRMDDTLGYNVGFCDSVGDITFALDFSGKIIDIPATDLLDHVQNEDGTLYEENGREVCFLAIEPAGWSSDQTYAFILGDIFLRSMYISYDLENFEIGIAQSKIDATESKIEEITEGIPGYRAPSYASNSTWTTARTYDAGKCPGGLATTTKSGQASGISSPAAANVTSTASPASSSFMSFSNFSVISETSPSSASLPVSRPTLTSTIKSLLHTSTSAGSPEEFTLSAAYIPTSSRSPKPPPKIHILPGESHRATITVVDLVTTVCSQDTTFTTNGHVYTASPNQTVSITNCPCTIPLHITEKVTTTCHEDFSSTEFLEESRTSGSVVSYESLEGFDGSKSEFSPTETFSQGLSASSASSSTANTLLATSVLPSNLPQITSNLAPMAVANSGSHHSPVLAVAAYILMLLL